MPNRKLKIAYGKGLIINFVPEQVEVDGSQIEPIDPWTTKEKDDDEHAPMLSYLLINLKSDQQYQLEITARNDFGWSTVHPDFVFKTAEGRLAHSDIWFSKSVFF